MASAKAASSSSSAAMKKRGAAVAFNEKEDEQAQETECVICLDQLSAKLVGSLDSCEHRFCFECIESWGTTRENTCPLCKARFKTITKHDPQDAAKSGAGSSKGKGRKKRLQKITVQDRDQASSLEPPIPQHFLFPPFILFNPQNYMDFGDFGDDDDDDEDDAAAMATLENFLVDPLAAFARLASGAGGGGGVGGQGQGLFRGPPPAPHAPRTHTRVGPARSDPVATLVEFSRRNAQNHGGMRAAPAPRFGIGGGGGASSGSSSRAAPRSDGVGSSASNPVVLVNDGSDDDSDEVRIVSGPSSSSSGSAAGRVRRHTRERHDHTWGLVFGGGGAARINGGSSSSGSSSSGGDGAASSSEANQGGAAGAASGSSSSSSSSMHTRSRRFRGAQRQAQESEGGGAAATGGGAGGPALAAPAPTRRGDTLRFTGGTEIESIALPGPARAPAATQRWSLHDVVELDSPVRRPPRARAARSGRRNWAEDDEEFEV